MHYNDYVIVKGDHVQLIKFSCHLIRLANKMYVVLYVKSISSNLYHAKKESTRKMSYIGFLSCACFQGEIVKSKQHKIHQKALVQLDFLVSQLILRKLPMLQQYSTMSYLVNLISIEITEHKVDKSADEYILGLTAKYWSIKPF